MSGRSPEQRKYNLKIHPLQQHMITIRKTSIRTQTTTMLCVFLRTPLQQGRPSKRLGPAIGP
eukprot:11052629-Alexandrium_andersonii.AAC.1